MVNHRADDDSTLNNNNATITSSCQLLDTSIEDATNNKKTVYSTMEAVIRLMKEVDSTEKAAEQAKEEAARSSLHILAQVEELKQARQCAKETNDEHAKEVYAQKVVLDTKVKELQSRVSGVLNQGCTSLVVLDEMCRALEKKLTSALREKELADIENLKKESLARKALADEEIQMKKVEEESERLKQEEVKNSKLQQFLADRGHVVDMLDGDISVKCKDVNLLKQSLGAVSPSEVLLSGQISSIVSEMSSLTNEISKERNKPADSSVVLEKRFIFGLNDSADKNVQSATRKQPVCGKSVTLVVPQEHELLSKISDLDFEKHEGNKYVAFKADKKDEQIAELTKLGHAIVASLGAVSPSEVLLSGQISSIVSEMSSLTNEISKERNKPADSSVVLEKRFIFGLNDSADKNVQSATQKQSVCGKSVTLVVPQEHELLSKISDLDFEKHEGNKYVAFKADKKDEQIAEVTKLGHATSTEGFVAFAQGPAFQCTIKKGSVKRKVNRFRKK